MWSRIKNCFGRVRLPISIKLTMLYTSILFIILMLLSLLTISGMHYLLIGQAKTDVDSSIQKVMLYLENENAIEPAMLEQSLLENGVKLRIYDSQAKLILDSDPNAVGDHELHLLPPHGEREKGHEGLGREIYRIDATNESEMVENKKNDKDVVIKQVQWNYHYLEFRRDLSESNAFLRILSISLIAVNLIGLLIAVLSGLYLSRKILQPIRGITRTAKEIEINNLDTRINITGSDDELKELSITFNHMLDRIQKGFELQKRFISDASHELRTPVTVITGYAEMLDRWGKEEPDALAEGVEAIKSEAANMHSLIEKLLFIARADKGKQILCRIPFQLEKLIEEVYRETCLIAPEHRVILDRNDAVIVLADEGLLKQMLRIFVENSIKFTPSDGLIRINSEQDGSYVEISIKDTGIGIPNEDLLKIFDRFYRVDKSRTKTTGGNGLGLSIAQWIADQHQCEINVSSTVEEGTTIRVKVPIL